MEASKSSRSKNLQILRIQIWIRNIALTDGMVKIFEISGSKMDENQSI